MPTLESTWIGPDELVPGDAHWEFVAEKVTVTIPYEGSYAKMLTDRPKISGQVEGFSGYGLRVIKVEISKTRAPSAEMTVYLEAPYQPDPLDPNPLGDPTYEIEWAELSKAIEGHPRCGSLKNKKRWDEWESLEAADYDTSTAVGSPAWTFENYISLKKAGTESWSVSAPMVRRQSKYYYTPTDLGLYSYKRQNPPSIAGAPTGYDWLKGADRFVIEGPLRTRSEEWIGFQHNQISSLIYD